MAYVNVSIHAVWGTKNREPYLSKEAKTKIIDHIVENARNKQIHIVKINGYLDHLHALIKINADMSIAKVMQYIKGESSFWINKNKIIPFKFEWADEYYAASVSESQLKNVIEYIENQEEHHRKKSFSDEVTDLIKL